MGLRWRGEEDGDREMDKEMSNEKKIMTIMLLLVVPGPRL